MSAALPLPPRPQAAPPGLWRFPAPEQHRLDNGVKVYLHHLPGQHAATVVCHLGIPLDSEPDGCDGIAAVMAASLGKRTHGITGRRSSRKPPPPALPGKLTPATPDRSSPWSCPPPSSRWHWTSCAWR